MIAAAGRGAGPRVTWRQWAMVCVLTLLYIYAQIDGSAIILMVDPIKRDLGVSDTDLARVRQRCSEEDLCVLGLRFTGDTVSPAERFARLRSELGDHFVAVEIDSSAGNPDGYKKAAHSVLTEDLRDEEGTATRAALDQVLELFRSKLLA